MGGCRCRFQHPLCRFDLYCSRPGCTYAHSNRAAPAAAAAATPPSGVPPGGYFYGPSPLPVSSSQGTLPSSRPPHPVQLGAGLRPGGLSLPPPRPASLPLRQCLHPVPQPPFPPPDQPPNGDETQAELSLLAPGVRGLGVGSPATAICADQEIAWTWDVFPSSASGVCLRC